MTTLPQPYAGSEDYAAVCYTEADGQRIAPILQGMQERGFRVWHGGDQPLETVAEHLTQCNCIILFISDAGLQDQSLRREINFSIELNKNLLVVYLEDVSLSAGMRLQLGTIQAMFLQRHGTLEAFLDELLVAKILEDCFTPKAPAIPEAHEVAASGAVPEGLTPEEYYKGGIRENQSKQFDSAAEWFRAAAMRGHTDAMCWLAFYYSKKLAAPKNPAENSNYWLIKASNSGNKTARGILDYEKANAQMFNTGTMSGDTVSILIKAGKNLTEGAQKGNAIAQYYLSRLYYREHFITVLPRPKSWYGKQGYLWRSKAEAQGLVDKRK